MDVSVSETDAEIAAGQHRIAVDPDALLHSEGLFKRHEDDVWRLEPHHVVELPLFDGAYRCGTEPERQQAVEGGGGTAALQMTQDQGARVLAGALRDLFGDVLGHSSQDHMLAAELRPTLDDHVATLGDSPLGHDYEDRKSTR